MNIVCIIAYDGSRFCGFEQQKYDLQRDSKIQSVAGFFTKTLQRIGIHTHIIGSGRTDKGVHATYQVINFHAELHMSLDKMKKLLNDRLYPSVFIRKIFLAHDSFHARFSAKVRSYRYIFTNAELLPFYTSYIAKVRFGDIHLLQQALSKFQGEHDFSLFKKNGSDTTNFIRTIYQTNLFAITFHHIPCYVAHISANSFLRSQIRLMIKACFEVSLGRITIQDLQQQIHNEISIHDKKCIRELAPANGLYLSRVTYDKSEILCNNYEHKI